MDFFFVFLEQAHGRVCVCVCNNCFRVCMNKPALVRYVRVNTRAGFIPASMNACMPLRFVKA